jgi:RND family efflux transporter MFP subunit
MTSQSSTAKKWILPIILIVITAMVAYFIKSNPPEAKRRGASKAPQMTVEAQAIQAQDFQIFVESYGTVKPRTQSALVSQVSGQIIAISDDFREGGFFQKGDVLVKLDDRDYQVEVKVAEASLLSSQQVLLEEQAKSEQAQTDWQRLGNNNKPSDLVLRKPQLAAAQAKVLSAEAQLQKAKLALERTKIRAPFSGRILSKSVDVGQVISMNTRVAEIYATDYVEVRLPIKNKDLNLMMLPEQGSNLAQTPEVLLTSDLAGEQQWQGRLVRTEGAIDTSSQQLYVVAQIDAPFTETQNNRMPIKIGQYVNAKITGVVVKDALVIPNNAIYQGSFVYLIEDSMLKRTDISIMWQNSDVAIVATGMKAGDTIVTSPLGQVSSGTRVSIYGENKEVADAPRQFNKQGRGNKDGKRAKNGQRAKDGKGPKTDELKKRRPTPQSENGATQS